MSVIFIPPSSAASIADATETSAGKIRIATSAEATAGTNDVTAMTPAKVKAVVEAAVAGGVTYQGTFDAGSPADLSNALKGDLYIISGAGTYAGRSWAVGDHLLVNADMGGTLDSSKIDKIDSTDSVTSVAGRTGAVVLSAGDVSGLAAVATTGAYSDLSGTPSLAAVATTGAYSDLSGTPTLATVATSGAYSDLSGLPTLGTAAALNVGTSALNVVQLDASARLPAVDGSLLTNLPLVSGALDDLSDVTITTPSDRQVLTYDSATSEWVNSAVAYADVSGTPTLATVATSGAYSDLSGTPTLATVATTGAYSDLSGLPTLGTAAALNVGTSALNVVQLDASARLPAVDGSLLTNLPLVSGALDDLSDVTITTPSDRQVLTYDSATSEWVNSAVAYADVSGTPTLATVATSGAYSDLSGTPTLATVATTGAYSDLSGLPTLGTAAALNVGTSALNVVQLDASAKLPAVDGSALTNLPSGATTLDALTDVTISSATNGQALIYNSSTSQWVNAQVAYANVSGTPTLATVATTGAYSDLSGLPTLGTAAALNVGTSALNVVQLDASAKLPAVDGSALTNLPSGATTLDALTDVTISSATNGQALIYNSSTSQWVNAQVAYANVSGTPTLATVATTGAYSDLSGLPTLGTAAALDVGTSALNVVQLDASAKLPAVDGSQLTNLPSGATTLDALTDVTITSVSNGQALTYNSATSAWVNSTLQQPGLTSAAPGSSYTISTTTNGSHVYILTPSTDCAVSLPAAATAGVGYIYHIKNLSIYALTITPQAGETIDNASTFVSAAQYGCVTIVSDGGNWWII